MIYITPILTTERLLMKRGTSNDYQKVYEYDFTKLRDITGEFRYEKLDPKKIEGMEEPYDNSYDWIVYLKDSMIPIANIVADREQNEIKAIELAFNTHPNYWKKGYTKEAIIKIMDYLFEQGYENILCGYDEGNIKSKSIIEKLGFTPYAIKENAWMKNNTPITTFMTVMPKERFKELYKKIPNKRKR